MSSKDCFEIGLQSYFNGDYYHASLWMKEPLALSDNATDTITNADILEYLAFYMFIQGETSSDWREDQLVFFLSLTTVGNKTSGSI